MNLACLRTPILLSALAAILSLSPRGCTNPELQPYAGRWLLKSHGKNMMLLTIKAHRETLTGTLVLPRGTENSLGEFIGITLPIHTRPVTGRSVGNTVELTLGPKSDQDRTLAKLADRDHLLIAFYRGQVPDWRFERVSGTGPVQVSTDWPTYDDDPKIVAIRQQLQAMAQEDQAARKKPSIDPNETDALAAQDGPFLESIFKQYGWPKISVFDVSRVTISGF